MNFSKSDSIPFQKDGITTFKVQNIDVSLVNAIRRTIMSDIPNVAFYFDPKIVDMENADIVMECNNSPLHNEFISQRLSMIPIHASADEIENWDPDEFKFEIRVENNSSEYIDVTSADIKVFKFDPMSSKFNETDKKTRDAFFPKNSITQDYILITKLPPKKKSASIFAVSMKATKNTAMKHACWSMTSLCTFENEIDENLRKKYEKKFVEERKELMDEESAKRRYGTLNYQRAFKTNEYNEPDCFVFKLESECGVSNEQIFSLAMDRLMTRLKKIKFDLDSEPNVDKTVMSFDKSLPGESGKMCSIEIDDEDHTIGNLLQAMVYNMHIRPKKEKEMKIDYVGYYLPHPLQRSIILKIRSSLDEEDLCTVLQDSVTKVLQLIDNLKGQWNEFTAQ